MDYGCKSGARIFGRKEKKGEIIRNLPSNEKLLGISGCEICHG
jgi:hypothetical protein